MERDLQTDDERDGEKRACFDLGEPSLANLLAAIDAAPDLPAAPQDALVDIDAEPVSLPRDVP